MTATQRSADRPVRLIQPPRRWGSLDLRELWSFRELGAMLALRDIKVRYKQTALGVAWALLQPLTAMVVFSVVFGRLAKMPSEGFPYSIYVYSALLPWTFFSTAVTQCSNSLVGSSQLLTKAYFPRLLIPMGSIAVALVDLAVSTTVLLGLMAYYRVPLTAGLLAVPLLVLGVVVTAFGIGTLLASLTVTYRDFRFVVPFLMQIWLFATPVVYPPTLFGDRWQWLVNLNPMAGLIDGMRSAFLGKPFDPLAIAISSVVGVLLLAIGVLYFERTERRFADII